jgi:catechol 2,3-dioxygenase-like lactoylglutathione lyase family enzyme
MTAGQSSNASAQIVEMPFEVLVLPVSDVGRAKEFYASLGWRLDADRATDEFRLVQFTPPGSACSIQFGTNISTSPPGSAQGLILTVSDIQAARDALVSRGAEVSDVFHCATGTVCRFREGDGVFERAPGPEPDHASYSSFVSLSDPDGNGWLLQEVTVRLPGRVDADHATFTSSTELASALRRAAAAHGEHEQRTGQQDANWPDWYAEYIVREQAGKELLS